MPQRYLICIGWLIILAFATWLRVPELDVRPMHADEATGARILSNRLESNDYSFDPKHYHGPFLSYSSSVLSKSTNEFSWQTLTKSGLRMGPVVAGILLTLTPLIWARRIGQLPALAAASLLASSPLLVYYNRMYIHESWLLLFAMLACGFLYRLLETPRKSAAILCGISIGLMFATKETFVISLISWGAAALIYFIARQQKWLMPEQGAPPLLRSYLLPTLVLAVAAAFISILFYSNGFRSFQGVADAVRTYFVYETSAGHDKSLFYYLELMLWPKHSLGIWWTESAVALLGLIAILGASLQRSQRAVVLFLAISACAHFAIYSVIAYKTPWLMLVPWAHVCLLAGIALRGLSAHAWSIRLIALMCFLVAVLYQTHQSTRASGPFSNDARNPYAYVPSSRDLEALQPWLGKVDAMSESGPLKPIAVIGSGYWPLPWYLRDFETVGYWTQPTESMQDYPVVIAMSAHDTATAEILNNSHIALPRGLRNNVSMTVYLRNDLWEQWSEAPTQ